MWLKWTLYMPLGTSFCEAVPSVEFRYLGFTRMPSKSDRRLLRSLLLCPLPVERYQSPLLICTKERTTQVVESDQSALVQFAHVVNTIVEQGR